MAVVNSPEAALGSVHGGSCKTARDHGRPCPSSAATGGLCWNWLPTGPRRQQCLSHTCGSVRQRAEVSQHRTASAARGRSRPRRASRQTRGTASRPACRPPAARPCRGRLRPTGRLRPPDRPLGLHTPPRGRSGLREPCGKPAAKQAVSLPPACHRRPRPAALHMRHKPLVAPMDHRPRPFLGGRPQSSQVPVVRVCSVYFPIG